MASTLPACFYSSLQVASYGHSYTLAAGEGNPCSMDDAILAVAVHPQQPRVAVALGE